MGFRVVGRVLLAQGFSSVGTSMSTVALAIMVYRITGSVLQMGGILAASTLPLVVTAWIGGALLDRYSARNVMVVADALRALLIFSMPFLAQQAVGLVYVVAALMGILTGVFNPGQIKLIGELVEREHLVKVNSYLGVCRDGAELIGYPVGGVVAYLTSVTILGMTLAGYTLAFVADAASYTLSAALLVGLPRALVRPETATKVGTLVAQSPAVLRKLWRQPALRTNLLLAVFAAGAVMTYMPNSYGLALQVFGRGSLGLAALEVFVAVGLIVGGLLFSRTRLGGDRNAYVFLSVVATGVALFAVGLSRFFWVSVVLLGVAGVATIGMAVPSITMFQEIRTAHDKGRVIALRTGFGQLGVAAGFVVGGLMGSQLGIKRAFLVSGAATILMGLVIYVPYRLGASRRARAAWSAATEAGATRSTARQLAREAAYVGMASSATNPGAAAWAAAAEEAILDDKGSGK